MSLNSFCSTLQKRILVFPYGASLGRYALVWRIFGMLTGLAAYGWVAPVLLLLRHRPCRPPLPQQPWFINIRPRSCGTKLAWVDIQAAWRSSNSAKSQLGRFEVVAANCRSPAGWWCMGYKCATLYCYQEVTVTAATAHPISCKEEFIP